MCTTTKDGLWHRTLFLAYVGSFAFGAADTLASEIGVLSRRPPVMIVTGRTVPRGTNGGVSFLGFGAAAVGALLVGLSGSFTRSAQTGLHFDWAVACTALLVGVFGSVVDSVLGATFQYSGVKKDAEGHAVVVNRPGRGVRSVGGLDLLSNTGVNFVASLVSAVLAPLVFYCVFRP